MRDYEQRLLRQGASWATPAPTPAYKALLRAQRAQALEVERLRANLAKAMLTTRRNTAGVALLARMAGQLRRAQEALGELELQVQRVSEG